MLHCLALTLRGLIAAAIVVAPLAACSGGAPPCPFKGAADTAPSAGCFVESAQGLLLVQGLNGKLSPPGGSSEPGESAQCTAFRETWEETGLQLQPRELLEVFDTGFHLYRCDRDAWSGEIDPPGRLEVRGAFFVPAARFDRYEWRYPDQQLRLQHRMLESAVIVPH